MSCYNSQLGKLGRFSQPDRQSGGQHTWHVNGMSKFTSDMSFTLLCATSQINSQYKLITCIVRFHYRQRPLRHERTH